MSILYDFLCFLSVANKLCFAQVLVKPCTTMNTRIYRMDLFHVLIRWQGFDEDLLTAEMLILIWIRIEFFTSLTNIVMTSCGLTVSSRPSKLNSSQGLMINSSQFWNLPQSYPHRKFSCLMLRLSYHSKKILPKPKSSG